MKHNTWEWGKAHTHSHNTMTCCSNTKDTDTNHATDARESGGQRHTRAHTQVDVLTAWKRNTTRRKRTGFESNMHMP